MPTVAMAIAIALDAAVRREFASAAEEVQSTASEILSQLDHFRFACHVTVLANALSLLFLGMTAVAFLWRGSYSAAAMQTLAVLAALFALNHYVLGPWRSRIRERVVESRFLHREIFVRVLRAIGRIQGAEALVKEFDPAENPR